MNFEKCEKMKLPKLTHGVSACFFGGRRRFIALATERAESPEAEKEAFIRRAYARGFLRRGIKDLSGSTKGPAPHQSQILLVDIPTRGAKRFCFSDLRKRYFILRIGEGFTLIELILYITLVSIIVVFSSLYIHALLQSKIKSRAIAEVEEQGVQMTNIATQSIRNAQDINSPSPGETADALSLETDDPEKNPTILEFSQNALWMKEGSGENIPLSGNRVLVSDASFRNLSRENTPGIIRIQFTLSSAPEDVSQEYKYSQTFYVSAALR